MSQHNDKVRLKRLKQEKTQLAQAQTKEKVQAKVSQASHYKELETNGSKK